MKQLQNILLVVFLCAANTFVFADSNVPLSLEDPIFDDNQGRSLLSPIASVNSSVLTLNFSSATETNVLIVDQSTNQTVYSDSFAPTTQVIINLDDEGIGEGSYLLRIYAFGKWWRGEFVLEEEKHQTSTPLIYNKV